MLSATEPAKSVIARPAAILPAALLSVPVAAAALLAVVAGVLGRGRWHPLLASCFSKHAVSSASVELAILHTMSPHSAPILLSPPTSSQHALVTLLKFELHEISSSPISPGHRPDANQGAPFKPGGP